MLQIGPYTLDGKALLAPMAGVTDKPYRDICRQFGAALTTSEMVASDSRLRKSLKSRLRLIFSEDEKPRSVQIVGSDPKVLAEAARFNVDNGAQIIDINMGCPVKKVCNVAAGSALLKNEKLVATILESVVNAVDVPVTLKTRTGWDKQNKNGIHIAKIAEDSGISALAVHGRTRECAYRGKAEYDTIAAIKSQVNIPVIVNGDITSVEKVEEVLNYTNADAVMIGRATQGNPWIFREINEYLASGIKLAKPTLEERLQVLTDHITNLTLFYGEYRGVRIARKHIKWHCEGIQGYVSFKNVINKIENADTLLAAVNYFFHQSITEGEQAA